MRETPASSVDFQIRKIILIADLKEREAAKLVTDQKETEMDNVNTRKKNTSGIWVLAAAMLCIVAGFALYAYHGDTKMEQAANNSGTTTSKFDPNAMANQGSTPPGDARAVGGDRTK
jgi:hypothetical protein